MWQLMVFDMITALTRCIDVLCKKTDMQKGILDHLIEAAAYVSIVSSMPNMLHRKL